MATCTAMYAIPAHRTYDARRATTDLRVVIAGPVATAPESPVTCHCGGESVGRMNPMIGRGTEAHVAITVWKVKVAAPHHRDYTNPRSRRAKTHSVRDH